MKFVLKKMSFLFIAFIICVTFVGCETIPEENSSTYTTTSSGLQENVSIEESKYINIVGEIYDKYGAEKATAFYKAISSNNIDKDYWEDYLETKSTIEMLELENKYIDIWKVEMDYAIDVLDELATEEQMDVLMSSQEKWRDNLDSYMNVTYEFLGESHGRSLSLQGSVEYRKIYRERVFEIKYYAFVIEHFHNLIKDNYTSLSFCYDSEVNQ